LLSSYGRYSEGGQVDDRQLPGIGDLDPLPHVPDDLVEGDDHGGAVLLRKVERPDRLGEDLLDVGRSEADDRVVAVRPPLALHDVALAGAGRNAGRRPAAHHVDDDARNLGQHGEPHVLLLEREAGTGGGGKGLAARERAADHRRHRRDLVLHLQEGPADLREAPRHELGHLGRRGDRVAAEEGAPRVDGAFRARLVPLEQFDLAHRVSPLWFPLARNAISSRRRSRSRDTAARTPCRSCTCRCPPPSP